MGGIYIHVRNKFQIIAVLKDGSHSFCRLFIHEKTNRSHVLNLVNLTVNHAVYPVPGYDEYPELEVSVTLPLYHVGHIQRHEA